MSSQTVDLFSYSWEGQGGVTKILIAGEVVHFGQDEFCALKVAHLLIRGRPEFVGFQRFPSEMTPRIQNDHELRIRLSVQVRLKNRTEPQERFHHPSRRAVASDRQT